MVVCLYICASWQKKKSSTVWVKKAFFFPASSWKYQYIGWQLVLTFSCVFLQNTNWISNKPKSYAIDSGTVSILRPEKIIIPYASFFHVFMNIMPRGFIHGFDNLQRNFNFVSLRKFRFLYPIFVINHLCPFSPFDHKIQD